MTDGQRCRTCRWWAPEGDAHEPNLTAKGWRPCLLLSGDTSDGVPMAIAASEDEYEEARLWTAPDFGCVQWEAKP